MSGATTAATLAITAITTATSIYGQKVAEKNAQDTAKYNAQMAENEAATQKELARNEIQKGIAEKSQQQRNALRKMGEMRADMGASGFTLDSGSNLDLLAESAAEHQYDANMIMQNANMAAWQHEASSTNALNKKRMADAQYNNAGNTNSLLGMIGTGLNGVSTGINKYHTLKNNS